uniref:CEA cell adhesion molecule 19 n=1 Tax=Rhinolophus ferrumequinum TaxID=59479 RepID=A0A671E4D7_RHIFE
MESPTGTQCHFSKGLLLSVSVLALWIPQDSWADLHIQKIPEQPQKDQNLLLSVQGIPDTFQDFIWYLGEEAYGGTRLFTYIPELKRPQRDGSAMEQRNIVGFPNGSMLLYHAQPKDSGTYIVVVTINPSWTMRGKTEVQVTGECWALGEEVGRLTYPEQLLCDKNVYEVMPSPVLLVCPLNTASMDTPTVRPPRCSSPLKPTLTRCHPSELAVVPWGALSHSLGTASLSLGSPVI